MAYVTQFVISPFAELFKWPNSQSNNGSWNPLAINCSLLLITTSLCWLLSILLSDYSQVDRIWSIIPAVYTIVLSASSLRCLFSLYTESVKDDATGTISLRLCIMALLACLWAVRLTFNFARKGGYRLKTGEDYRWVDLRTRMAPVLFQLFNLFFIAIYQNVLLWLLVAPAHLIHEKEIVGRQIVNLNWLDVLSTGGFLTALVFETIADQQQWIFQTKKHQLKTAGIEKLSGDYKRGFLTQGLFRYSRHPNFFCEIMIWWAFYLFSVAAGSPLVNISASGAALLTLLFQGSTWYTELLTRRKYSDYAEYSKRTNCLIPGMPKSPANRPMKKSD